MAFVTSKEMFAKALKSDYAVGAFNVNNMEIIQGIVDAAKQKRHRSFFRSPREQENTQDLLTCSSW